MAMVWTKKSVIVASALAGLLVVGLGINFVVLPTLNSVSAKHTEIEEAELDLAAKETQLNKIQGDKESYTQIKSINDSLSAQFPDNGETQLLIDQIQYGAAINGIPSNQLSSITFIAPVMKTPAVAAPVPEPTTDEAVAPAPAEGEAAAPPEAPTTSLGQGYAELSFTVSIMGTPEQIQGFLNYVNSLDRAILVSKSSFTTKENSVILGFTGTTFIYAPIPNPTDSTQVEVPVVEVPTTP